MARRLLGSKAGESLVELAVSIAILSLIVLWAMSAFGAYAKTGQDLDLVGQAVFLADSEIERLKTCNLTDLNLALPDSGATSAAKEFVPPSNNYYYEYTRSADEVWPDEVSHKLRLIEITMTVFDKATGTSVYVVKTSFLRGGEQNVGD